MSRVRLALLLNRGSSEGRADAVAEEVPSEQEQKEVAVEGRSSNGEGIEEREGQVAVELRDAYVSRRIELLRDLGVESLYEQDASTSELDIAGPRHVLAEEEALPIPDKAPE